MPYENDACNVKIHVCRPINETHGDTAVRRASCILQKRHCLSQSYFQGMHVKIHSMIQSIAPTEPLNRYVKNTPALALALATPELIAIALIQT